MNMRKYIGLILINLSVLISGCNDWLSVYPSSEMPVQKQFGSEQGVQDALTGVYIQIKTQNLYGKSLSFGYIDNMASLWDVMSSSNEASFSLHQYAEVTNIIDGIYGDMYNAIANINNILDHIQADNGVITTPGMYEIIRGECLALRAFLHFDLMRLFGPAPEDLQGKGAKLSYVKTVSKEIKLPVSYEEYKEFALEDLQEALSLLKANDPIVTEKETDNNFLKNRVCRMNYYAVRALQARAALWYGMKQEAYDAAMEVIDARNKNGERKFDINTIKAAFPAKDFALTSEHIWGLYDHELATKYTSLFQTGILYKGTTLQTIMRDLFGNTGTDFREVYLWELKTLLNGDVAVIKKFYEATQIPLIRLSELYFIAIETGKKEQVQGLWDAYRTSRVLDTKELATEQEQLRKEILTEFRKEFYAEGQLFYLYKRYNSAREDILFANSTLVVNYVLPLPKTELN